MLSQWAQMEVDLADLGDQRLNTRLLTLLSDLGNKPNLSIPAACGGHAETQAAYRFFDNPKATFQNILSPHYQRTLQRMSQQQVMLLVQDSSEIELDREQLVGVGELDGARRGVLLHVMHGFTPDGTPLGTLWADCINRSEGVSHDSANTKRKGRKEKPLEEKESYRWIIALEQSRQAALALPGVQCICIADSEADIYELFAWPLGQGGQLPDASGPLPDASGPLPDASGPLPDASGPLPDASSAPTDDSPQAHWLVRACQDRALAKQDDPTLPPHLLQRVLETKPLCQAEVSIRHRQAKTGVEKRQRRVTRDARKAKVEIRASTVTLRPPWRFDRKLPPVTVNVVLVSEVDPPEDQPPLQWILLTTLAINTIDEVRQIVQYYCVRWNIEIFFRTLKSGCRIEYRRFEHVDRILPAIAVYLIVAWRTLFVSRMGRACPDADCEIVFEPCEWKSVWMAVKRKKPPKKNPPLGEMVNLIASLGGYIQRPNKHPGPQTIWIGLQRTHDLSIAWSAFGPETG